jgi:hypothetical protein
MEDMEAGRVVLGGCCVTEDDPKWQCADCEAVIYERKAQGKADLA